MTPEDSEFIPIEHAPKDGRTLLVADETGWRAVAYWSDDFWALGHKGDNRPVEQIEFEPTKFVEMNA